MDMTHYKLVLDTLKVVGIALGGGWALWTFTIQRRFAALIEFDLEAKVLARDGDASILECGLLLTNRGLARQKIRTLRITVRGIRKGSPLSVQEGTSRLMFPEIIATRVQLIPEKWGFTFVDPGVAQRYSFSTPLPKDIDSLLVHGSFKYRNRWKHTAERVFPAVADNLHPS